MADVLYAEDRTPPEASKGDDKAPVREAAKSMIRAAVPLGGQPMTKMDAIRHVMRREADGCYVLTPEEVAACFDEVVAEREAAKPGSQQPAKSVAEADEPKLKDDEEPKK